ncbi:MAG: Gfo/Idh/MocA family oxidoreductase [Armatimonadota bacterium]
MANGGKKKGIGIIGFGGFGEFTRRSWDEMDNVEVIAVCDSDPVRAPLDVMFYQQVGPLLANPHVDIVSIATPPNSHKDIALMALEAEKHVLVEKPLALSEADAREIKRTALRNERIASVDFVLRYNPIVEELEEIVRQEVLGKLRRIDLRNYAMLDQTPEGHWFWNPQISGRIFLEHGVHFFDIAHSLTQSSAKEVCAVSQERKPGIEDRVFAAVVYENGVIGTFWHSFSRPRALETTTFHFAFDLGEIDIFGWIPLDLNIWGWTDKRGLEVLQALEPKIHIDEERMQPAKAASSEFFYDVEYAIHGKSAIGRPKMEVYAENLRAIMNDFVHAIDEPGHSMRVTLDDGIEAVRTAEMATKAVTVRT